MPLRFFLLLLANLLVGVAFRWSCVTPAHSVSFFFVFGLQDDFGAAALASCHDGWFSYLMQQLLRRLQFCHLLRTAVAWVRWELSHRAMHSLFGNISDFLCLKDGKEKWKFWREPRGVLCSFASFSAAKEENLRDEKRSIWQDARKSVGRHGGVVVASCWIVSRALLARCAQHGSDWRARGEWRDVGRSFGSHYSFLL